MKYLIFLLLLCPLALAYYGGDEIVLFDKPCLTQTVTFEGNITPGEFLLSNNCDSQFTIFNDNLKFDCECNQSTIMYTNELAENTYNVTIDYTYQQQVNDKSSSSSGGGRRKSSVIKKDKVVIEENPVEDIPNTSVDSYNDSVLINEEQILSIYDDKPKEPFVHKFKRYFEYFLSGLIVILVLIGIVLSIISFLKRRKQNMEEIKENE